jgi:hypothetical protein
MNIRLTIALSLILAALLCWAAMYTAQSIAKYQTTKIERYTEIESLR